MQTSHRLKCARRETSCVLSNLNRRCRFDHRPCRKSRKTRDEIDASSTNLARRNHRTQQYSITALTDSLGAIQERYAYDAYGNLSIFDGSGVARTSTAGGNRYTYTGREWDEELGLYHFRARIYLSQLGRFGSKDPIGYVSGTMLYELTASSPLMYADPLGLVEVLIGPNSNPYYAPWSDQDMGDDVLGQRGGKFSVDCTCDDQKKITCTFSLNYRIRLNVRRIKEIAKYLCDQTDCEGPEFWEEKIKYWIYGHEQRHWSSQYWLAKRHVQNPEWLFEDPCKSCKENAKSIQTFLESRINIWIGREYGHKTPPIGPEASTPYVPLNPLPPPTPLIGPWVKPSYPGPYPDPPLYQQPITTFPSGIPPDFFKGNNRLIQ